jgi:hypothetical protein
MTGERAGGSDVASARYEGRDANARRLVQLGLALCLVIVLALLGVAKLMAYLTLHQPAGPPVSPLAPTAELPPKPRLQITPHLDLARKRAADDAVLNSYAWIDRSSGTVRIPIDRAMDLVAERLQTPRDLAAKSTQTRQATSRTRRAKER